MKTYVFRYFDVGLLRKILTKQDLLLEQQTELLQPCKQMSFNSNSGSSAENNSDVSDIVAAPMDNIKQMKKFGCKLEDKTFRKKLVNNIFVAIFFYYLLTTKEAHIKLNVNKRSNNLNVLTFVLLIRLSPCMLGSIPVFCWRK